MVAAPRGPGIERYTGADLVLLDTAGLMAAAGMPAATGTEAEVAAAMSTTLERGSVARDFLRAEVGDGERRHVADDLAEGEVQPRLALADERGLRDHRERGRRAVGELEVHHLWAS